MDKVERLITLMHVLLETPRPLTKGEVRERVQYPASDASFHRAFERDKDEIRKLGVGLEISPAPGTDPPTDGYRIPREEFELRDPGLEPDELEALNLAAALVGSAEGVARQGLLKLGAGAGSPDPATPATTLPADPNLVAAFTAVSERRVVRFTHRDRLRTLEPHRLRFTRGHWYLVGRDTEQDDGRAYRMDRITSPLDLGDAGGFERPQTPSDALSLEPWAFGGSDPVVAEVWIDPEVAPMARHRLGEVEVVSDDEDGLVVRMTVTNRDGFRSWLLGHRDRAEVLGPPDLRAEVVDWLRRVAAGGHDAG